MNPDELFERDREWNKLLDEIGEVVTQKSNKTRWCGYK